VGRWNFFLLIGLLCAYSSRAQDSGNKAAGAEQATGTIGGTVLRKDTGEAIRFAHVSLIPEFQEGEDIVKYQQKMMAATTDTAGRFVLTGLASGTYQIIVSKNGFVEEAYGARRPGEQGLPFKLGAGQHAEDLAFKLTTAGVITGRVRDENGEPTPGAMVSALQIRYSEGKRALEPAAVAHTNDLGEFRLFNLTPGKYLVSVSGGFDGMATGSYVSLRRLSGSHDMTVYYPGTTELSQATTVNAQAGGELHEIEIAMQSSKTFHIRGQIIGASSDKNEFVTASVLQKGDSPLTPLIPERSGAVDKDGKFDIEGVPSGSYNLLTILQIEEKPLFAHKEVEVAGADVEGMILVFEPFAVVQGHLKWDDGTETTKMHLQVYLRPAEMMYSTQRPAEIGDDGNFEMEGVTPGLYSIEITGPVPDAFLKSAKYGAADAMGTFRVSGGAGGSLELLVGAQGARVGGVVVNSDPVVAPGVWVALIPEAKHELKRLYQAVKTDASGKYEFRGVAPGSYNLFSWDQVEDQEWEDLEFMKAFEGKGAAISVAEKENKSVDLTLIENRSKQGKP
jgi:hypothetical protein